MTVKICGMDYEVITVDDPFRSDEAGQADFREFKFRISSNLCEQAWKETLCHEMQIAMGVIQKWIDKARCGIFKSRNVVGDRMNTIYDNEELGLTIDICFGYNYFEVFGLTEEEFKAVEKYYNFLRSGAVCC